MVAQGGHSICSRSGLDDFWFVALSAMFHITNGTSVSIPQTGLPGQVVCWNDILHDGPVPGGLPLQELSRIRERFLVEFFAVSLSEVSFAP